MLTDRQVLLSFTTFAAWAAWLGVAACVGIMVVVARHDVALGLVFGTLGCILSAVAATLHIRRFFCTFSARMREAFMLGREVEKRDQEERQMRLV